MFHELKIRQEYLIHILENKKIFEAQFNDRNYQVGDLIKFLPLESKNYNCYQAVKYIPLFEIIYVHHVFGMEQGYVVLGIKVTD